jgi:hypothetical protein
MKADPGDRQECINEVLATAPDMSRGIVARAFAGTASKRDAIKAMCLTCVSYERGQITECPVYRCPLWLYRPYQGKAVEAST